MADRIRYLILVMLTCPRYFSYSTKMNGFYQIDNRYKDVLPIDALLWTRNGSISVHSCGLVCSLQSLCLSFFFDNESCHGYPYRMDDRKDTTVVLGMRYAEPKGMVGNIALMKPTLQGTFRSALAGSLTSEYAVDGHRWPGILQWPTLCSISEADDNAPYWQVDLQQSYVIHMITVLIKGVNPIATVTIDIIDSDGRTLECTSHPGPGVRNTFKDIPCHAPTQGQTVRITKNDTTLSLCEVEIYGTYP